MKNSNLTDWSFSLISQGHYRATFSGYKKRKIGLHFSRPYTQRVLKLFSMHDELLTPEQAKAHLRKLIHEKHIPELRAMIREHNEQLEAVGA